MMKQLYPRNTDLPGGSETRRGVCLVRDRWHAKRAIRWEVSLLTEAIVFHVEMNRPFSAIAGGVAGTAVLSLLMILTEVQTRSQIQIFDVIARFVGLPEHVIIGFVLFVAAGVFAWPLLFIALEPYIPRGPDPAPRGMVLAFGLWIIFVITGRGTIGWPLVIVYAGLTLLAHLAYGFTLGVVYAYLRDPSPQ